MDIIKDIYTFINGSIDSYINSVVEQFINSFSSLFGLIMGSAADVLSSKIVIWGIAYTQAIALSIVAVKIASEAISTHILYTNGDPDADPTGLLVRGAQSIAIIGGVPWILRQLFLIGTAIAQDVINMKGYETGDLNLLFFGQTVEGLSIALSILTIVAVVFLVIIFLQTNIRAAELGSHAVIGAIIALNLTSTNRTLYSNWLKKAMVLTMSQGLQLFLLKAAFYSLASAIVVDGNFDTILKAFGGFFGWLYVSYKTPGSLQTLVYSSGVSNIIGGSAQQAGSMYAMRKMMVK